VKLPPNFDSRLCFIPGEGAYFVFITTAPMKPGLHLLDLIMKPGSLATVLTHDAGTDWTDRQGERLAEATLAQDGAVIMQFETMADALSAHRRLLKQTASG
jgi:hypothetical protein